MNLNDFYFLENLQSEESQKWVELQNRESLARLTSKPIFNELHKQSLEILGFEDSCKIHRIHNDFVYEINKTKVNPLGEWTRQHLSDYIKKLNNKELLLDFQKLSKDENHEWHWQGGLFSPSSERFLLHMSDGGKDEHIVREFNLVTKEFVNNGFVLPLNKGNICWLTEDLVLAGGILESEKTKMGFTKTVRLWQRGVSYEDCPILHEVHENDMSFWIANFQGRVYGIHARTWDEYDFYIFKGGRFVRLWMPSSVHYFVHQQDDIYCLLNLDWQQHKAGTVIHLTEAEALSGMKDFYTEVFEVNSDVFVNQINHSRSGIWLQTTKNCCHHPLHLSINKNQERVEPKIQKILIPDWYSVNREFFDEGRRKLYFLMESFNQAPSLWLCENETNLSKLIEFGKVFESKLSVKQDFATSVDGTKIPYFVIRKEGTTGQAPTLLNGYGGFAHSQIPYYLRVVGPLWLERGGVYVLANIRGGAEFGPQWHLEARYKSKQKSYDDFIAISEDLIAKKITDQNKLGIWGGSNGGLLVGNCFVQRPDLFRAVLCVVPLLDMLRFADLPPGAIWTSEYGDPKLDSDIQHLESISPYHQIKSDQTYPEVFFLTSTFDDRVHPSHARRMVAKMKALNKPCLFYEETKGGHQSQGNIEIAAFQSALKFTYLFEKLIQQ